MQLQIETQRPIQFTEHTTIEPLDFSGDVVLAVDQSKRNTAMLIATPYREIIKVIQFGSPGSANKTSTFCAEFEHFVTTYLSKAHIVDVFLEQPTGDTKGMHYYQSAMKLMEIRSRWVALSHSYWGIDVREVNNWSWKRAVLPDGYRSQKEKGSAFYFYNWYAQYGSDDVTDALGILLYGLDTWHHHEKLFPNSDVAPCRYVWVIQNQPDTVQGEYNPALPWDANLRWFATNVYSRCSFLCPRELLSQEDIESHALDGVNTDAGIFFVSVWPFR